MDACVRDVVYLGLYTRYLMELDGGGDLMVVQQNLHTTRSDALSVRDTPARLIWLRSANRFAAVEQRSRRVSTAAMLLAHQRRDRSIGARLSTFLYLRPGLLLLLFLGPPLIWMVVVYLGSLVDLAGQQLLQPGRFHRADRPPVYPEILRRAFHALQPGYRPAHRRNGRCCHHGGCHSGFSAGLLYRALCLAAQQGLALPGGLAAALVELPGARVCLETDPGQGGHPELGYRAAGPGPRLCNCCFSLPAVGGPSLSLSPIGIFIVFTYVWLPYMIIPIQAALERVPKSMLEASGDLGAQAQTRPFVMSSCRWPSLAWWRARSSRFRSPWAISSSRLPWATPAISSGRRFCRTRAPPEICRWLPLLPWCRSSS